MTADVSEAQADLDLRRQELEIATREHREAAASLTAAKHACEATPGKKTLDAMRAARVAVEAAADALGVYTARAQQADATLSALRRARDLEALRDAQDRASELAVVAALQPLVADLAALARAIHSAVARVDVILTAQQSAWIEAEALAGELGVPARATQLPPDLAATLVRVALFNAGVPDVADWVRPEGKPRLLSEPMALHERAKQLLASVEAVP